MPKITITCTKRVTYSQIISVSEEELAILQAAEGDIASITSNSEAYDLLEDRLDHTDIFSSDDEYQDIEVETDGDEQE